MPEDELRQGLDAFPPMPARRLTARERRVADELGKLDLALVDLFHQALLLGEHPGRPGLMGLAAHAARELTNGVMFHLVGYRQATREPQGEDATEQASDTQAELMAKALGLHKEHASVQHWHRLHRDVVSAAHYGGMRQSEARARRALEQLPIVLDAIIGPYFDVETDLAPILATSEPSDAEFERVLAALGQVAK